MKGIQQLREQRQAKAQEARKLLDDNPGDKWGDDQQKAFDALEAEIDRLDGEIARHERVANMETLNDQRIERRAITGGVSTGEAEATLEQERVIFDGWLRGGVSALSPDQMSYVAERRAKAQKVFGAMSTGTGAEGGYLVPEGFGGQLLEEVAAYGGMREVATVMRTAMGNEIPWPTVDDTAEEGEIVGENAAVAAADPSFGVVSIAAYKYSSKAVAVPFELLQDAGIDIEAYVRGLLARRIGRITNKHFTIGTGINQPRGVAAASVQGKVGAAGQTAAVTYDDLVDLEHSVDPDYRNSGQCRFMFHDQTLKVIKKLKDNDGRPLWLPGLSSDDPDTILRYPYGINQHMPTMAANAKSILFGDFSKYVIRDVMDVLLFRMTDSKYTEKGQVGFLAFSRHDGDLIAASGNCIKHYANSSI